MKKIIFTVLCFFWVISVVSAGVIFEANFDDDHTSTWEDGGAVGHLIAGTHNGSDPGRGVPAPFTGYINHSADNTMRIANGYGRNGGYGLRIDMQYDGVTNQVGLAIYLPNESGVYDYQGYDEIYIRMYVKYAQDFDWIGDETFYYHKWGRIWQNVPENRIKGNAAEGDEPDQNMSREENTGYTVFGVGEDNYSSFQPYAYGLFCKDASENSSAGRAIGRWNYTYQDDYGFVTDAYGDINVDGTWAETQDWHCWEWHIKLSSGTGDIGNDDGEWDIWIDGVKQGDSGFRMQQNPNQNPATGGNVYGPPPKLGVGINYISLFDNADSWSEPATIYADDIVISTEYIGPDYVIGSPIPIPNITGLKSMTGGALH